jgi:uncharacterized membrane protein (UPF0127 family)
VLAGCSAGEDDGSPAVTNPTTARRAGGEPFAPFEQVTVTVVDAAGVSRQFCLWLADTETLRERGLMYVDDPRLGGKPGMLFRFDTDVSGGFWMKNTLLPLSLAYIEADGVTRSITDMDPCPADADCPTYPAGGTYRYAIEVPRGHLPDLGISDRSRVSVAATGCGATPPATGSDEAPGSEPSVPPPASGDIGAVAVRAGPRVGEPARTPVDELVPSAPPVDVAPPGHTPRVGIGADVH